MNDRSTNCPGESEIFYSVSVRTQSTFSRTRPIPAHLLYTTLRSLHSRKLHILGFRARTVCTNSLVIFFFSLSDKGTYHFWSLSLPCRLNRSMNCICNEEMREKQRSCETLMGDEGGEGAGALNPQKERKEHILLLFMWWRLSDWLWQLDPNREIIQINRQIELKQVN